MDLPRNNGRFVQKHGMCGSPTYISWQSMLARCKRHPRYAGRIAVCERWHSFENFLADMGERPEGTTLDRFPDKAGNYEPGNCRWATWTEQERNRKTVAIIDGKSFPEWMEQSVVSRRTVKRRLANGWSIHRAISTPDGRQR